MTTRMIALGMLLLLAGSLLAQPTPHPAYAPIRNLVQQISADSIAADILHLATYPTRHTFSDTTSETNGVGAALRWVQATAQSYDPNQRFSFERFPWSGNFNGNSITRHLIIGRRSGTFGDDVRYIIGGHLDSRTVNLSDNTGLAPGADDNGSTCAALLEMLRLLPDSIQHNLEIIWFTGEEEGLWGSAAYAQYLSQQSARIDGMIAMDMISHMATPGGDIDTISCRLYAQGDADQGGTASVSRNFQRYLKWVGEAYADIDSFDMHIIAATDRPGRGSDHMSFSGLGYPALRVIERNEDLAHQHSANDTPEFLSPTYARRIAMTTFGGLLTMLQAPARPSSPVVEQTSADTVRISIPDSVALPANGRFYVTARNWSNAYFDAVVDIGTARTYNYSVTPGTLYAFSVSRADSNNLPSPFSTESVLQALPVTRHPAPLPSETTLTAAPNPFNAEVMFTLDLAQNSNVSLEIFDLLGRHVATLINAPRATGIYHVNWSPQNAASGVYVARLITSEDFYAIKVAYIR